MKQIVMWSVKDTYFWKEPNLSSDFTAILQIRFRMDIHEIVSLRIAQALHDYVCCWQGVAMSDSHSQILDQVAKLAFFFQVDKIKV